MINHARRKKLLRVLDEHGRASVAQLEQLLCASAATVRRDIVALAECGKLRKLHGGAQRLEPDAPGGLSGSSFADNQILNPQCKRAIARRAAQMCANGETVIINGGSTTHMMAAWLADSRLTILTNSFLLAQELLAHSGNEVLLPGGKVYRRHHLIVSPFDNDVIQNHYASKMFIGACAVSPMGLLESDPLLVRAETRLLRQADEVVALVDSSKFQSRRAGLIACPLQRIATLVTDSGVDAPTVEMLQSRGVQVIVVDPLPPAP